VSLEAKEMEVKKKIEELQTQKSKVDQEIAQEEDKL